MMPGTLLAMFAKYWQPGEAKTRLAAAVGAEAAARLHRVFVETLLGRMQGVADRRLLVYTPLERQGEFAALLCQAASRGRESISSPLRAVEVPSALAATKSTPDPFTSDATASADPFASSPSPLWGDGRREGPWALAPQSAGDLGERIRSLFQSALAAGTDRVILIGSDSPTLPIEHVQQAFDELRRHDVVLGPSDDGGYYLIGLSAGPAVRTAEDDSSNRRTRRADASTLADVAPSGPWLPPVFDGMAWSTPQVWLETIGRLEDHGYSYAVLPNWYDVDETADLERLCKELHATHDESLKHLYQAIGEILCRPVAR